MGGTAVPLSGSDAPVHQHRRATVDGEGGQHFVSRRAAITRSRGQHLSFPADTGRWRSPAATASGAGNPVSAKEVTGTGSADSEASIWWFSLDVRVFLPSCHGASTVRLR